MRSVLFSGLAVGLLVGCGDDVAPEPTSAQIQRCQQLILNMNEIVASKTTVSETVVKDRVQANCGFLNTHKETFKKMALEHFHQNIQNPSALKIKEIVIKNPDDQPVDPRYDPHGYILGVYVDEPYKDDNHSVKLAFTVNFDFEDGTWIMGGY